jgi:hypothetical protein
MALESGADGSVHSTAEHGLHVVNQVGNLQTGGDQVPNIGFGEAHLRRFFMEPLHVIEKKHTAFADHDYAILIVIVGVSLSGNEKSAESSGELGANEARWGDALTAQGAMQDGQRID